MGFIIIGDPETGKVEILGDEVGQEKARKALGLPHRDTKGKRVTKEELNQIDKQGE